MTSLPRTTLPLWSFSQLLTFPRHQHPHFLDINVRLALKAFLPGSILYSSTLVRPHDIYLS
jgi:hypothetical protein